MLIRPIDYFLVVWFALAVASTVYVAWDQYRNNPEPTVIKWGFILVTLYTGPIGVLLYVLADKEPRPGEHEEFIHRCGNKVLGQRFTASLEMLPESFWQQRSRRGLGCRCGS